MTNNQNFDNKQMMQHNCCCSCISWSAVFAGTFVAIGLSFLLYAFQTAIGLSVLNVSTDHNASVALGGFITLLVGGIITMFISGWVTGRLNRGCCCHKRIGLLAGFITWCLTLIVTAVLAVQLGQLLNMNQGTLNIKADSTSRNNASLYGQATLDKSAEQSSSSKTIATLNNKSTSHEAQAVKEEKVMHDIGKALFLTFFISLAGAIASAIGGYCGMMRCRKETSTHQGTKC